MQLLQTHESLLNNESAVKSISKGLLYYVSTHRNAWHSTWIGRYSTGCMHTTLESAKEYAEQHRVRGTVFIIKQLPCLVYKCQDICLIVTEINTSRPLLGYNLDINEAKQGEVVESESNSYLKIGAPLNRIVMSFLPSSRFWYAKPNPMNSIIMMASRKHILPLEKLKSQNLLSYSSFSNGGNYYLGWTSFNSKLKKSAVKEIHRKVKDSGQ